MASKRIGVGIIGITPGRSWAAIAHVPALRALAADFDLVALSTTRMESARAAAAATGIPKAYDDHRQLANDPAVDLVAVTVKVPHHFELVRAAIDAGKHVYCEWPLGNGLAEAEEMAALARRRGVLAVVGLQARAAPVINYVQELVQAGFVGEVLSSTLIGSGMAWGPVLDLPNAYAADRRNGATLLSIPFGHTIDAICQCLGPLRDVSARLANRRTSFTVAETGEQRPLTSPDQLVVSGTFASGAVAAVHYRGGASRATNLLWEINGTAGDLQVTSIAGHAQMFELKLAGANGSAQALEPMDPPARHVRAPAAAAGFAANVAVTYGQLANDLRTGSRTAPGFDDAVRLHRLLAAIEASADANGARVAVAA